jgi:predicted PurR-regulated permease PerM
MNAPEYPTPWQKKTIWSALTGLAVVTLGTIFVGLIWLGSEVLAFLQPILIPFAVAAVMAYLLDPVVSRIVSWGWSRHRAVFAVFGVVTISFAGVMLWIVPAISQQSINLARKVPDYTRKGKVMVMEVVTDARQKVKDTQFGNILAKSGVTTPDSTHPAAADSDQGKTTPVDSATQGTHNLPPADSTPNSAPAESDLGKTTPVDSATQGTHDLPPPAKSAAETKPGGTKPAAEEGSGLNSLFDKDWLTPAVLATSKHAWSIVRESLGGFLGVLGFLLSLIIVPIYLYYFLIEARNIAGGWSDYLPLRASAFKDEVVSVLNEINGYLIAFFRGQLVVSLVNGSVTALGLVVAGLDFGLLIGITLCFLGLIPYLGITLCWIASAVIASLQGGSWCVPGHPWWIFPLVISGVFIVVHNIDGLFVTPKIVGESVGLHPLTVIVSVFVWSLLMGGLLGAILAVPMTATVKVLLRRYVWERRFRTPDSPIAPADVVSIPVEPEAASEIPAATPPPPSAPTPAADPLPPGEPVAAR